MTICSPALEKIPCFLRRAEKNYSDNYIHGNSIAPIQKVARVSCVESCMATAQSSRGRGREVANQYDKCAFDMDPSELSIDLITFLLS